MKFIIFSLLLCSELISAKLTEVMRDEFNTQSIDANKWKFFENYDGGQENFTRDGVRVENSNVYLNVMKSDKSTNGNKSIYTASGLQSIQGWTYGVFEINCSLELNRGRASFVLVPKKEIHGQGIKSGAITVFTNLGGKTVLGVRYSGNDEAKNIKIPLKNKRENSIKSGFHVFTLEWNKTNIIWKIDNKIVGNFKLNRILSNSYTKIGQPFDHEFELAILADIGHPEFAAETGLENSSFIIDYVKVFKIIDDQPVKTDIPDNPMTTDKPVKEEKPDEKEKPVKNEKEVPPAKEVNRNKRAGHDSEDPEKEKMQNITQIIVIFVPLFVVLAVLFITGYFVKRKMRRNAQVENAQNESNQSHFQIMNDVNSLNQKVVKIK